MVEYVYISNKENEMKQSEIAVVSHKRLFLARHRLFGKPMMDDAGALPRSARSFARFVNQGGDGARPFLMGCGD